MDEQISECNHDWRWRKDWAGHPESTNYNPDPRSRWECNNCGEEDSERDAPDFDDGI